jgi:hypothetical protein
MGTDLHSLIRHHEIEVMLEIAAIVRESPDGPAKEEEAQRLIYAAMYRFALGQITEEERKRILDLLRPCCPDMFFSPPAGDAYSPGP